MRRRPSSACRRRPATEPAAPVLELRDVDAGYGPFRALFGVSFSIPQGQAVALLGANGAGKTTVARVVSGLVAVTAGAVLFDGVDITGMKPWDIARSGIVHAPEGRSVFGTLTVEENLTLAFRRSLGRTGRRPAGSSAPTSCSRASASAASSSPATLSGGEQRMLSLARVLVQPPRLLIADELSLGLAPIIVDEVYATLDRVRREGTALLLIEQYVGHALRIADAAVLLQHGEVVFDGPAADLGDTAERLLPGRARDDAVTLPASTRQAPAANQLPCSPAGTRKGSSTRAIGPAAMSEASSTTQSLRSVVRSVRKVT